jgi:hypothetical protein
MPLLEALARYSWAAAPLILGAATVYVTVQSIRSWASLRHVPGPRWAGVSKWWLLRNTMSGKMHLALKQVCDEYGT